MSNEKKATVREPKTTALRDKSGKLLFVHIHVGNNGKL